MYVQCTVHIKLQREDTLVTDPVKFVLKMRYLSGTLKCMNNSKILKSIRAKACV